MLFYIVSVLLIAHFIGDFILQTDWMAKNKSSSNVALLNHVSVYGFVLLFTCLLIPVSIVWVLVNVFAHFCTDYISSRITKRLWADGKVHDFFVIIGLDQTIHYLTLIWTYWYFVL